MSQGGLPRRSSLGRESHEGKREGILVGRTRTPSASSLLAPMKEKPAWMGLVAWLPAVLPIKEIQYLVLPGLTAAPASCEPSLGHASS